MIFIINLSVLLVLIHNCEPLINVDNGERSNLSVGIESLVSWTLVLLSSHVKIVPWLINNRESLSVTLKNLHSNYLKDGITLPNGEFWILQESFCP